MIARQEGKGELEDRYVALLRGINVGGKNILPMKDLVALFSDTGCADPRSYIQSGNVIFRAQPSVASRLPTVIVNAIADRFGFNAAVVLRSAEELRSVVKENPFIQAGVPFEALHIVFLRDIPSAAQIAALDPDRSLPDEFVVRNQRLCSAEHKMWLLKQMKA